jgi:hypothetical protein
MLIWPFSIARFSLLVPLSHADIVGSYSVPGVFAVVRQSNQCSSRVRFQLIHRSIEDAHAFGKFSLVEKAVAKLQYKTCFSVYVSAVAILSHVSGSEVSCSAVC